MFPVGDDNPTIRRPVVTYAILGAILLVWIVVQGGGGMFGPDPLALVKSVCNLGLVPAELTHLRPVGYAVPLDARSGLACVVDNEPINTFTPVTSMFLHGGWGHLFSNSLFFWVFGNNVEDSMGRLRFVAFYLLCGLAAAGAHVLVEPSSPIPTVGASGAISGVMGAYLLLYPKAKVRMYFPPIFLFRVSAWLVLLWWFGTQVISGLPDLMQVRSEASGGVAVWAHVGGFIAGAALVKLFENKALVLRRDVAHESVEAHKAGLQ
jgi:membrane associated rhomboid family serine protease